MDNVKLNVKYFKGIITAAIFILAGLVLISCQENKDKNNEKNSVSSDFNLRFEHLAMNVEDPVLVADWYKANLPMIIIRQDAGPEFTTFISDSGRNMMYEFYHKTDSPQFKPSDINHISFHIASIVPSIENIKEKLLAKGAAIAADVRKSDSGDNILVLRDPWGLPIQFIERAEPMLRSTGYYFEHIAFNVADSRAVAKWYVENLGMVTMRESGEPSYGRFIADAGKNMMLELYQNPKAPIVDFNKIDFISLHLAFTSDNLNAIKEKLVEAGAKVVQDIKTNPGGNKILVLRDPWGFPLQFVNRVDPLLK